MVDIEYLNLEQAKTLSKNYNFGLVYMLSELKVFKNSIPNVDWEQVIEARFFDENSEIHIFNYNDEMKAVLVKDTNNNDFILTKYELAKNFKNIANTLVVKQYLDYDEDGQAFIKLTRLESLEG